MTRLLNEFGTKIKGTFILGTDMIDSLEKQYTLLFVDGVLQLAISYDRFGTMEMVDNITDEVVKNLEDRNTFLNVYMSNVKIGLDPSEFFNAPIISDMLYGNELDNHKGYYFIINKKLSNKNNIHLIATNYGVINQSLSDFKKIKNSYLDSDGIIHTSQYPNSVIEIPITAFLDYSYHRLDCQLIFNISYLINDDFLVFYRGHSYASVKTIKGDIINTFKYNRLDWEMYINNNAINCDYYNVTVGSNITYLLRNLNLNLDEVVIQISIPEVPSEEWGEISYVKDSFLFKPLLLYYQDKIIERQNKAVFIRRLRNAHSVNVKK